MSDDNDNSPSAAEIVDSMAEEMGIEDEDIPESEFSEEMIDELGGLFGASSRTSSADASEETSDASPESIGELGGAPDREVDQEETVEMSLKVAKAAIESDSLDEDVRDQLGETLEQMREQQRSEDPSSADSGEDGEDDEILAESLASLAEQGDGGGPVHKDVEQDEELNVADEEKQDEETSNAEAEADEQPADKAETTSDDGQKSEDAHEDEDASEAGKESEDEQSLEADDASDDADAGADASEVEAEGSADGEDTEDDESLEPVGEADATADAEESDVGAADGGSGDGQPDDGRIAGVFNPDDDVEGLSGGGGGDDLGYLDEDDLGEYGSEESDRGMMMVIGGIIFLMIAGAATAVFVTGNQERLYHLFKGDLHAWEKAKTSQEEREFEQKQKEKLPKFGQLTLKGNPSYATIKLDGEIWYGQVPESKEWKKLRLTGPQTMLRNLDAKRSHEVEINAPGHEPKSWELTEEMWSKVSGSDVEVRKSLTAKLEPKSELREREFKTRLEKDTENDYYGEVTINTMPSGAEVIFDGDPLLDEDGEEMTTPVTFSKYYVEDKESGELEEKKVKVDTPPDNGHKIQIRMPDDEGDYPDFVASLERQMWTCDWKKSEEELKELDDDANLAKECDYEYTLDLNYEHLKNYIEERKQRKEEVESRGEDKEDGDDSQAKNDEESN